MSLTPRQRIDHYRAQTGRRNLTARQLRRLNKKQWRMPSDVAEVGRMLDGATVGFVRT